MSPQLALTMNMQHFTWRLLVSVAQETFRKQWNKQQRNKSETQVVAEHIFKSVAFQYVMFSESFFFFFPLWYLRATLSSDDDLEFETEKSFQSELTKQ